ncbi:MAG: BatD family protein, partial [Bdellovibrionales bacterium]|nr:BatD family protein [Bdellovibrionales bacterium]
MGKIGSFLILLVSVFFVGVAWGNEVSVEATVDRNVMEEGDTFILAVSVTSGSSVTVEDPRLPSFKNMDLINSWSAAETRSSFSNGKFNVEQTRTFNYMLAPSSVGEFRIDSVQVVVNGQAFNTKPITVTVKEAGGSPGLPRAQRPKGQPPQPLEELDDLFSQLLRRRNNPGFKAQPTNPNESFFIQVEVDKTTVFAGEQVTASWFLYTRGHIRDIDTLKYPSLNGFWKEEIDLATRLDFQQEVINGIVYRKALLASYALFPIKPGKAKI